MITNCDLCDAKNAREFISQFKVNGNTLTMITFSSGREVQLKDMSDEDAVKIAHELYEMQKEAGLTDEPH